MTTGVEGVGVVGAEAGSRGDDEVVDVVASSGDLSGFAQALSGTQEQGMGAGPPQCVLREAAKGLGVGTEH